MSLISFVKGIFRKNELDPTNDIYYDPSTGFMLNKNGSMGAAQAMRESTVFSCVRIISDGCAQMDLELIQTSPNGDQKHATSNPLYAALKYQPCTWMSGYDYWKWNLINLCLRGFFLSKKLYSTNGKVIGFVPYHPDYTEITQAADGTYIFKSVSVQNVNARNFRSIDTITQKDAYYCMYATLDGVNPVSPIKYAAESIRAASEMRKHGQTFFSNTAIPPGVLTVPDALSDKAFDRLRDSWQSKYGGNNTGKPAILEQGMKFEPIAISNEDAQYLETRGYTREEIAAIYGVPPYMVGDTKQAKGWSTIEAQSNDLLRWTFNPWIKRIEDASLISLVPRHLRAHTLIKFNTFELTRGAMADRQAYYEAGVQNGFLSPNEVRKLEGLNQREGGDKYVDVTAKPEPPPEPNLTEEEEEIEDA